ncbi:hypothetical protein B484DRAFT_17094 [Ochromonadaceae sp. CCMP2298]|nr:hypothetical protein B484DRAFT_17094 [Ochromonadaceae sp. CCMP2298]
MDEESVDLDLNSLESFNFLFKNLWSVNLAFRAKLNIVDTILFKDGFPYIWFFTSEKTGDILKKKAERLVSVPEIVRALKIKSRSKGYKESSLRTKIATVWYIESSRHISSHIVDEVDLARILDRGLGEVLAVQAFMGGEPAKGNGVFEHRMWMQRNGAVKHITYEMIDVAEDHSLNRFTSHADKLVNNEYQHSLASSLCKHLAAHIGMQVVYPSGSAPHAPTVDPQALVLPSSVTEDALRRNADALSLRRQIQQHEAGLARDRETKLLRDQEILMEQATQAQVVTHEQEQKSEERMEQLRLRRLIHSQRQSVQNEGQARPMSPSLKVQGNYSDEVRRELERSRMPSERQFVQMKNEMLAIDGVGGVGGSSKQQQEGPSASSKPVRRRTFDEAANTGDAQTGQGQVCPTLDTSRADSAAQFAQGNYVTGDIHARLRAHPQPDQTQTEQGQGGLLKLLGLGTVQGRASLPSSAGALHRDRGGDSQLLKAGLGSTATPGSSPSPQPPTTPYPSRPAVRPRSTSSVGRPRKSDTGDGYSRGRGGGVGRLMASAVAALDSAGAVGLGQAGRAASSGDSYYAVSLALSDALETQHGERKRSPRSLVPVPQPRGGSRRPTSAPSTT